MTVEIRLLFLVTQETMYRLTNLAGGREIGDGKEEDEKGEMEVEEWEEVIAY